MEKADTLTKFGEILMQQVQDVTLSQFYATLNDEAKTSQNQSLVQQLSRFTPEQIDVIKAIATNFIDEALHQTLFMFEQDLGFQITDNKNQNLAEISDGLSGELYTENGWIKRFSQYLHD